MKINGLIKGKTKKTMIDFEYLQNIDYIIYKLETCLRYKRRGIYFGTKRKKYGK